VTTWYSHRNNQRPVPANEHYSTGVFNFWVSRLVLQFRSRIPPQVHIEEGADVVRCYLYLTPAAEWQNADLVQPTHKERAFEECSVVAKPEMIGSADCDLSCGFHRSDGQRRFQDMHY
jgi:hypothetical protein